MRKNARTVKSLFAEATKVKKEIEAGKLKGKKLQAAKYRYGNLMYRARKREKSVVAPLLAGQGLLPNFLKQMDMVRIQEMVAEKLFQQIKESGVIQIAKKNRKAS